ncbi:MAG: hypothetical protein ACE5GT_09240 [Rhodospirillales bacterium]
MRPLIPALLLLLALPVRAEINKPSFECFSQTPTAIEMLLCQDPLLGAWEGQLAARAESAGSDAVAAHRAWLRGLGAGCGLGAAGGLPLPARWRAAPCVVEGMRHRLLARSLAPEPAPAEAPPANGIHPNCSSALSPTPWGARSDDPVPLKLCNKGNAHIPTRTYNGFLFADGPAWYSSYFGYRMRGRLGEGIDVVQTVMSGGGSGSFSAVLFIRGLREPAPWPGPELVAVGGWFAGDRCNGGLRELNVAGPAAIETAENITSFDLFTLDDPRRGAGWRSARNAALFAGGQTEGNEPPSRGAIQLEPYVDLETSAGGCIGTVHYRYNLSDGSRELLGVTLEQLEDSSYAEKTYRVQACFNAVVAKAAGELPHRFSPQDLGALKERFRTTCIE